MRVDVEWGQDIGVAWQRFPVGASPLKDADGHDLRTILELEKPALERHLGLLPIPLGDDRLDLSAHSIRSRRPPITAALEGLMTRRRLSTPSPNPSPRRAPASAALSVAAPPMTDKTAKNLRCGSYRKRLILRGSRQAERRRSKRNLSGRRCRPPRC